jgi:hypothetical protein
MRPGFLEDPVAKAQAMALRGTGRVFLAYFPYLKKIKVGLCDLHAVYASVSVNPPILTFYA